MALSDTRQLDLILNLKDKASAQLDKFSGRLDKMEPTFKKMSTAGAAAFSGISAGVGIAVAQASRFDTSMANVSTLIDENVESMEEMKKNVVGLSKELPVPLEELSSSLYDIRSAGISADEAMSTLESSAKLSAAGLSTTQEATNILTSALNSFSSEGLSANETSDILFKTVKAGKTTISDLAISFGASAPVIADAGIKLADFQAATAALTTTGLPASQAQMGLRQAIVALTKPTGDMEKLFKGLGVNGRELIKNSDNMGEVFAKLKEESDKQNVSWEKSIGSVEALNAVTGLLGETGEAYKTTLSGMTDGTNAIDEAYQKQSETFAAQSQKVKNQVNALFITIGTQFIPVIEDLIKKVTPIIEKFANWIEQNPELTKKIIVVTGAIAGVVSVIGGLGLVLPTVITGFTLLFSPIGLITVAIGALIAAGVALWKNWDKVREKTIDPLFESFKRILDMVGKVKDALKNVGGNISEKFGSAGDFVKNAVGVDDAVITPKGDIISTHPDDYLIATKTPEKLAGAGGGNNINIYLPQGIIVDRNSASKVADVLSEELRRRLRI